MEKKSKKYSKFEYGKALVILKKLKNHLESIDAGYLKIFTYKSKKPYPFGIEFLAGEECGKNISASELQKMNLIYAIFKPAKNSDAVACFKMDQEHCHFAINDSTKEEFSELPKKIFFVEDVSTSVWEEALSGFIQFVPFFIHEKNKVEA